MHDSQYKQILLKERYFTAHQIATLIRQHQLFLQQGGKSSFVQFLLDFKALSKEQHEAILERIEGTTRATTRSETFRAVTDCLKDRGIEIIGNYTIIKKVGSGGMGTVYQARHNATQEVVAIKILNNLEESDILAVKRFQKEAQLASQIKHQNVVEVKEFGVDHNIQYLVMEYVEGKSLTDYQPRNVIECLTICSQICQALALLHRSGIIHRDIKTDNILMDMKNPQKPIPKLTDFSLAFRENPLESRITQTGTALGTPYYMSPEQAMGQKAKIDLRTDIYSLGVMLYFIIAQQYPFTANTLNELYAKIMNEQPIPISTLRRGIRKELDLIIAKALAKDPDDRYATCEQMDYDLRSYIKGRKSMISNRENLFHKLRRKGWFSRTNIILGVMSLLLGLSFITIVSLAFSQDDTEISPTNKPNPISQPNNKPSNQSPSNQSPSNQSPSNQSPSNQSPSNQSPSNQSPSNQSPSNQSPSNVKNNTVPTIHQETVLPPSLKNGSQDIEALTIIIPSKHTKPVVNTTSSSDKKGNAEHAWQLYKILVESSKTERFWEQMQLWQSEPIANFELASSSRLYQKQTIFQAACFIQTQQFAKAWHLLESVKDNQQPIFYYFRCQARAYIGDWERALEDAKNITDLFPDPKMDESALWYYLSWQQPERSFWYVRMLGKKNRTAEQSLFITMAFYWLTQNEYFPAENLELAEELADRLDVPAGYLHLARLLAKQGKISESVAKIQTAKKLGVPDFLIEYYYQAMISDNPIATLKNVIQTTPNFTPAYFRLISMLLDKSEYLEAKSYFQLLQNYQNEFTAQQYLLFSKIDSLTKRYEQTLQTLDKAIESFQQHKEGLTPSALLPATAFVRKAAVYQQMGNADLTLKYTQIALDMAGNNNTIPEIYFLFYGAFKKHYEALEDCDWIVPEKIYNAEIKTWGRTSLEKIKNDVLNEYINQHAQHTNNTSAENKAIVQAKLGFLYNITGNLTQGQKYLEQSLSIKPTAQAYYFLGQMYYFHPQRIALKLTRKSAQCYEQALQLDGTFHKARYALIRLYAESVIRNVNHPDFPQMVFSHIDGIVEHHPEYRYHDQFCHHANNLLNKCLPMAKNNTDLAKELLQYSQLLADFNQSNGRFNVVWSLFACADLQANYLNNQAQAITYYNQAAKIYQAYPYIFLYRGRLLNRMGMKKEALANYYFALIIPTNKLPSEQLKAIQLEIKEIESQGKQR